MTAWTAGRSQAWGAVLLRSGAAWAGPQVQDGQWRLQHRKVPESPRWPSKAVSQLQLLPNAAPGSGSGPQAQDTGETEGQVWGEAKHSPTSRAGSRPGQAAPHPQAGFWAGGSPCPPGRAQAGQPAHYLEARGIAAEALNVTGSQAGGGGQNLQN